MTDIIRKICKEKELKKMALFIKKLEPTIISFLHFVSINCIHEKRGNIEQATRIHKCIQDIYFIPFTGRMTLTYGDITESHKGMQNIGKMSNEGFSLDDLNHAAAYFKKRGYKTKIIHLNKYLPKNNKKDSNIDQEKLMQAKKEDEYQAYVFIARNGLEALTPYRKTEIATEVLIYPWDSKLYNDQQKIVQNKNTRHTLNFSDESQTANFEQGKGTTIEWSDAQIVYHMKNKLVDVFGEHAKNLQCEGNKYYDPQKTGIGYHGDTERKKVIGLCLDETKMNLHYMWYYKNRPRGYNISMFLEPGDIYCMSEKTVGTDWKKSSIYTLRHAEGAPNYTTKTPNVIVTPNTVSDDADIILGDITLPAASPILFYAENDPEHGYLSNYYGRLNARDFVLRINNINWPSVEHYFQASKFASAADAASVAYVSLIANAKTPNIAKILAQQKTGGGYKWRTALNEPIAASLAAGVRPRPDWDVHRNTVMEEAVAAKFKQNKELQDRLLATGDAPLVEASPRDSYWGAGADGKGQNRLGQILERVRANLLQRQKE